MLQGWSCPDCLCPMVGLSLQSGTPLSQPLLPKKNSSLSTTRASAQSSSFSPSANVRALAASTAVRWLSCSNTRRLFVLRLLTLFVALAQLQIGRQV